MANINELLDKIKDIQGGIWPSVANAVSEAANNLINLNYEDVEIADTLALGPLTSGPCVSLQFEFADKQGNAAVIVIPEKLFLGLVGLVTEEEVAEYEETQMIQMNPVLDGFISGISTALTNSLGKTVAIEKKDFNYGALTLPPVIAEDNECAKINVSLSSGDLEGEIYWLIDSTVSGYISGVEDSAPAEDSPAEVAAPANVPAQQSAKVESAMPSSTDVAESIAAAPADPFNDTPKTSSLDVLMDVSLEFCVELGRIKLPVRDIIDLGVGSIVEIDKAAGEPVDVMVNGSLVAQGEVVVVEDNFAVRVTEILSPRERLYKLSDKS